MSVKIRSRVLGTLFMGLLVVLVAILGVAAWRIHAAAQDPVPEGAYIQLNPAAGAPGTTISITGGGWERGETVSVYLVEAESDATDGLEYARAAASRHGEIVSSLRYPMRGPWISQSSVILMARGAVSGREARASFMLRQPTAAAESQTPYPVTETPEPGAPAPDQATPTLAPSTETPAAPPAFIPPTATPTPVPPTLVPATITDWRGEYFNTMNLAGSPLVRNDTRIDFAWEYGSPMPGIAVDNFSARWTRQLPFEGRAYRFYVRADDGIRLWIDGELILDQWHDGAIQTYVIDHNMTQGLHDIRLEMYEHTGVAAVSLWWEPQLVYPEWKGEYFADSNMQGQPVLVRNDAKIDFDWGKDAPVPGLPARDFGVRWTRKLDFEQGTYRFCAISDDGVRVSMDGGRPFIDEWHASAGATVCALVDVTQGRHQVQVEYYDHLEFARIKVWWERDPLREVPSGAIRTLDLDLWSPGPAYGALGSQEEFDAFLVEHQIRTRKGNDLPPWDPDGQEDPRLSEFRWDYEIILAAFLGEEPVNGYQVGLVRITHRDRSATVCLNVSLSGPGEVGTGALMPSYLLVAVERSALPRGELTFTFVDQAGTLRGRDGVSN